MDVRREGPGRRTTIGGGLYPSDDDVKSKEVFFNVFAADRMTLSSSPWQIATGIIMRTFLKRSGI